MITWQVTWRVSPIMRANIAVDALPMVNVRLDLDLAFFDWNRKPFKI